MREDKYSGAKERMFNDPVEVIHVPNRIRNAVKASSLIPLYASWFLMMIVMPTVVIWGAVTTVRGESLKLESMAVAVALIFLVFLGSLLVSFALKTVLSEFAAYRVEKFLVTEDIEATVRKSIRKQIRKKFWFDSITRTVPTPYRRIVIVGDANSRVRPFCVMDVGADFRTITLEHYQPGEVITPPLTRSSDILGNYKYFIEWSRGLTKAGQSKG